MQLRFFRVPAVGDPELEADLNRFLRSVRSLTVDRQFVADGANSFWSLCVGYLDSPKLRAEQAGRERVDYKEILSTADFALFAKLRDARKALAAEEAVPPYAVCTNEQLAALARARPTTAAGLRKIEGIGQAKAEKYGARLLAVLAEHAAAPGRAEPDASRG